MKQKRTFHTPAEFGLWLALIALLMFVFWTLPGCAPTPPGEQAATTTASLPQETVHPEQATTPYPPPTVAASAVAPNAYPPPVTVITGTRAAQVYNQESTEQAAMEETATAMTTPFTPGLAFVTLPPPQVLANAL